MNLPTTPPSKAELMLASRLLNLAADTFSNHGCNDFDLVLSDEEARPILVMREEWNCDEEETERLKAADNLCENPDTDWYMMRFLSARFRKAALEGPGDDDGE